MGITKPPAYEHPRKRREKPAAEHSDSLRSEKPGSSRTGSAGSPNKGKKIHGKNGTTPSAKKDTQFRLIICQPLHGEVPLYDKMVQAGVTPHKALLGLLKKGFAEFESELLAGKGSSPTSELKTDGKPVDTSRTVTSEFVSSAKETFDPFGILSERALGQCVAEAIVRSAGKEGPNV